MVAKDVIWGFPKLGVPLVIIQFHGTFHEINHPFLGSPMTMETPYMDHDIDFCRVRPTKNFLVGKATSKKLQGSSSELVGARGPL